MPSDNISLIIRNSIGIDISSVAHFRSHLEGKVKLTPKKLSVLNKQDVTWHRGINCYFISYKSSPTWSIVVTYGRKHPNTYAWILWFVPKKLRVIVDDLKTEERLYPIYSLYLQRNVF